LRIVAWNLNHRTYKKAIPQGLPEGIISLQPDVVVLTEYVEGPGHVAFCDALYSGGLVTPLRTPIKGGRHNQVLIVSSSTASRGTFAPPDTLGHASSNCLRVRLDDPSIDVVGLRVPDYKSTKETLAYWDWFETAVGPLSTYPTVIIGDLNVDPRSNDPGADHLRRLVDAGWQLPDPTGPWSYIPHSEGAPSRLDHALVSPGLTVNATAYITSKNGYPFAGDGSAYFSDHALLVLEVMTDAELV